MKVKKQTQKQVKPVLGDVERKFERGCLHWCLLELCDVSPVHVHEYITDHDHGDLVIGPHYS